MKLPKQIRLNYWYINRKPIFLIWIGFLVFFFAANLLLNFINFITNFINTL